MPDFVQIDVRFVLPFHLKYIGALKVTTKSKLTNIIFFLNVLFIGFLLNIAKPHSTYKPTHTHSHINHRITPTTSNNNTKGVKGKKYRPAFLKCHKYQLSVSLIDFFAVVQYYNYAFSRACSTKTAEFT